MYNITKPTGKSTNINITNNRTKKLVTMLPTSWEENSDNDFWDVPNILNYLDAVNKIKQLEIYIKNIYSNNIILIYTVY